MIRRIQEKRPVRAFFDTRTDPNKPPELPENSKKVRKNNKKLQKTVDKGASILYNGGINKSKAADTAKGSQP